MAGLLVAWFLVIRLLMAGLLVAWLLVAGLLMTGLLMAGLLVALLKGGIGLSVGNRFYTTIQRIGPMQDESGFSHKNLVAGARSGSVAFGHTGVAVEKVSGLLLVGAHD